MDVFILLISFLVAGNILLIIVDFRGRECMEEILEYISPSGFSEILMIPLFGI